MAEDIIIIGAGAHSKVIIDIIEKNGQYTIKGLIDKEIGQFVMGIPIIGNDDILENLFRQGVRGAFVAIGNNKKREKLCFSLNKIGYKLANAISVDTVISTHAEVGCGVAIMPGAVINANAKIQDGCIINTAATIDHDTNVGAFTHIAPGVHVCGSSTIGKGCFLGVGANVIDGMTIGNNTIIGAGSTVIREVPSDCTAVGTPAKIISQR